MNERNNFVCLIIVDKDIYYSQVSDVCYKNTIRFGLWWRIHSVFGGDYNTYSLKGRRFKISTLIRIMVLWNYKTIIPGINNNLQNFVTIISIFRTSSDWRNNLWLKKIITASTTILYNYLATKPILLKKLYPRSSP